MDTIVHRGLRLSRAKALIAASLATLAVAGTVQAANPAPAAARLSIAGCNGLLATIEVADAFGLTSIGDRVWARYCKECAPEAT
jgi:hypothetical protein